MTIEEAIERYTSNAEYERTHGNLQGCLEFRQLAELLKDYKRIKEQEPCADMVSRDAMWEVLQRLYGTEGELVEELMSLPPVLPIPKMGKWRTVKHYGRDYYQCTYCNMERMNDHSRGWNYCPFCGAKMQEVEE